MHPRRWLCAITAIIFILAGANHFRRPAMYLRIMPPLFPHPAKLIAISGACEIIGGIGLLFSSTRRLAALGLCLLLLAVFPANIFMATHQDRFTDLHLPAWVLWVRLPLQPLLMLWVWWVGISSRSQR